MIVYNIMIVKMDGRLYFKHKPDERYSSSVMKLMTQIVKRV